MSETVRKEMRERRETEREKGDIEDERERGVGERRK